MRNPPWSSIEDGVLKENYGKISIQELSKLLPGRNTNGIKARQTVLRVCKVYSKDDDFFAKPNTLNSSIAGILASDGHLCPRKGNEQGKVSLALNTKDIYLIQKFNELTKSNYKISSYQREAVFLDKRVGKTYNYIDKKSSLYISSANKWLDDLLKNWNIHAGDKSLTLKAPTSLEDLDCCLAYISGIITGDGSIFLNGDEKENCIRISLLGTEEVLEWAKNVFERFLGQEIVASVRKERYESKLFTLLINGVSAARIVSKINSLNILKLDRKWEKPEVLTIVNRLKIKYPHLFDKSAGKLRDHRQSLINLLKDSDEPYLIDSSGVIEIPSKKLAIKVLDFQSNSDISCDNRGQNLKTFNSYKENDVRLIQIFENELVFKPEIVRTRIKSYLGLLKHRIFARKCEIAEITGDLKDKFLNKYHIQGQNYGASINLGLFYKKRLVSIMSFNKGRGEGIFELSRFSCNKTFNVCGGASKLLAHFEKTYKPLKIVSFADRRWSAGEVYFKLNFKPVKIVPPSYHYFRSSEKVLHHKFGFRHKNLRKKLKNYDPQKTEMENMKNNGWNKIWDCGLIKFEKTYLSQ